MVSLAYNSSFICWASTIHYYFNDKNNLLKCTYLKPKYIYVIHSSCLWSRCIISIVRYWYLCHCIKGNNIKTKELKNVKKFFNYKTAQWFDYSIPIIKANSVDKIYHLISCASQCFIVNINLWFRMVSPKHRQQLLIKS